MSRASLLALAALVAAGCAGGSGKYAGLSRTEALQQASEGVADAANDPRDALYHHRVRLLSLTRGHDLAGHRAWLGRFEDAATGERLCIWVSAGILSRRTSFGPCLTPPPQPPPPTSQPPALS